MIQSTVGSHYLTKYPIHFLRYPNSWSIPVFHDGLDYTDTGFSQSNMINRPLFLLLHVHHYIRRCTCQMTRQIVFYDHSFLHKWNSHKTIQTCTSFSSTTIVVYAHHFSSLMLFITKDKTHNGFSQISIEENIPYVLPT